VRMIDGIQANSITPLLLANSNRAHLNITHARSRRIARWQPATWRNGAPRLPDHRLRPSALRVNAVQATPLLSPYTADVSMSVCAMSPYR
jgi:hypothetical protein